MLQTAYNDFKAAVAAAVGATTPAGHAAGTQVVPSLSDMGPDELKRHLAGAMFQLNDDTFRFAPIVSAVIQPSSGRRRRVGQREEARPSSEHWWQHASSRRPPLPARQG